MRIETEERTVISNVTCEGHPVKRSITKKEIKTLKLSDRDIKLISKLINLTSGICKDTDCNECPFDHTALCHMALPGGQDYPKEHKTLVIPSSIVISEKSFEQPKPQYQVLPLPVNDRVIDTLKFMKLACSGKQFCYECKHQKVCAFYGEKLKTLLDVRDWNYVNLENNFLADNQNKIITLCIHNRLGDKNISDECSKQCPLNNGDRCLLMGAPRWWKTEEIEQVAKIVDGVYNEK